jgi:hypothetical protein
VMWVKPRLQLPHYRQPVLAPETAAPRAPLN